MSFDLNKMLLVLVGVPTYRNTPLSDSKIYQVFPMYMLKIALYSIYNTF